jgi:sulfopyruvate decarboxylase TPP-binding subunit
MVRVCREGEAFALAAGLFLGGKKPVIIMQCTGLFEAGDSLRSFVHDLGLPLFILVGFRNFYAHRRGQSRDSAPRFAVSVVRAWKLPFMIFENSSPREELVQAYARAAEEQRPQVVFLAE